MDGMTGVGETPGIRARTATTTHRRGRMEPGTSKRARILDRRDLITLIAVVILIIVVNAWALLVLF